MVVQVQVQVLGPVRAWRQSDELELGGPKQRAVLALLAVHAAAGRLVSRAELVDSLWGQHPPASATNVLQTYVKRLRRLLDPDRPSHAPSRLLQRVGSGYLLDLSNLELDLARFRSLVAAALDAERSGDHRHAGQLLGEALRLWQGPPVANLPSLAGHPSVVALPAERWAAVAHYGEAMLATGMAATALSKLEEAAAMCPLDEAAQALLIRAHHSLGQHAQAMATFHAVRRRLADELGVDPGPELALAHTMLLDEDGGLTADGDHAAITVGVAPAQLPAAMAAFVGRSDQLQRLDQFLPADEPHDAMTIVGLVGTAGVGKTTLAVHWAHRVADRLPDGQLFVNLRGFDPTGSVVSPAEAIRGFLDALQVPAQRIPASPQAQAGLYRTILAGRRMLVVLDNARDTRQVRPLLPATPGCLVLVTSRDQLTGLVAADGAHVLTLDLLPGAEAHQLLTRRLGPDRVAAEPAAVDQISQLCAGLPLALAIVAARAATHPRFRLTALAEELRTGLGALSSGENATNIRAVFAWSYDALKPEAARLFRLLSLHAGPDLATAAAASLAGAPVKQVRPLLAELARAHLVDEHTHGRYAMHDLLRAYAGELTDTLDSRDDRIAALARMLDHYLHTAYAADHRMDAHQIPIALDPPPATVQLVSVADREQALGWFTIEHASLLECVAQGTRARLDAKVWQLVWAIDRFLDWHGHWHHLVTVHTAALAAAQRLGDQRIRAHSDRGLGYAYTRLGRNRDAYHHHQQANRLFRAAGDPRGEALASHNLGLLSTQRHGLREALTHHTRALELHRLTGYRPGEAMSLNAIAWNHLMLGDYRQALGHSEQSLAVFAELGDHHAEGMAWDTLGYAHHHLGDHQQAVDHLERALALHRRYGDRYHEAHSLVHLGETRHASGDADGAFATIRRAVTLLADLGHAEAAEVRAKLRALGG